MYLSVLKLALAQQEIKCEESASFQKEIQNVSREVYVLQNTHNLVNLRLLLLLCMGRQSTKIYNTGANLMFMFVKDLNCFHANDAKAFPFQLDRKTLFRNYRSPSCKNVTKECFGRNSDHCKVRCF